MLIFDYSLNSGSYIVTVLMKLISFDQVNIPLKLTKIKKYTV